MFGRRRKRPVTTADRFAAALSEMSDQFAGRVQVTPDGKTVHISASIPATTLAAVIAKMPRPVPGPYPDRDDA